MELREAWAALRSGWWLCLSGLVVGAGLALLVSFLQTPLYTARTQLFVSAADAGTTTDVLQGSYFTQDRIASYAELLTGDELSARVIDRLDLPGTVREVSDRIDAAPVIDTVLIDVSVSDPSPERALTIAEAVGIEFPQLVDELEAPDGDSASPVRLAVSQAPTVSEAPTSPQPVRNLMLGALAGLVLGTAAALLRRRLDRTVKTSEELETLVGAPVIGLVLKDEELGRSHVIARQEGNRSTEDFRQLRTNLQFLNVDEPPKVIMVTSAIPSEGKTTVVINLALALADTGQNVTIVEADLRRPRVTRYLGLVGGVGLTNVLSGTADLDDVVQRYGSDNLQVIPAGPTPPNPGGLLSSSQMFTVLDKLRARSDYVLVDAPPLLPVADASGLSVYMDGVLLAVHYGTTPRNQVQQAAAALDRVSASKLGAILNIVPLKADVATAYGYGYGYAADNARPS